MIKPDTLWGQFKTCPDDAWLGRVCRALGGQAVELDFGQQQMVSAIKLSAGWLDEASEARRSKWKEQKRNQRGRFLEAVDNADIADMSTLTVDKEVSAGQPKTPKCPPLSIHPSNSNIIKEPKEDTLIQQEDQTSEVCVSPARSACTHDEGDQLHPSFEEVVNRATSIMGIPLWFCRYWYDQVGPKGANWVGKDNRSIDRKSFPRVLNSWYRNAKSKGELAQIQEEYDRNPLGGVGGSEESQANDTNPEHWKLCREKCSMCYICGYGCDFSKKPYSKPEACPKFQPL